MVAQAAAPGERADAAARSSAPDELRLPQRRRAQHAPGVEAGDQAEAEQRPDDPGQVGPVSAQISTSTAATTPSDAERGCAGCARAGAGARPPRRRRSTRGAPARHGLVAGSAARRAGSTARHARARARAGSRPRACRSGRPRGRARPWMPEPPSSVGAAHAVVAHARPSGGRRCARHRHRGRARPRRACRRSPGTPRPRSRRRPRPGRAGARPGAATTSTGTRGARGEVVERGRQAAVGEDRRVDAAREVAQLLQREARLLARLAHQLGGRRVALLGALLGHAQRQRERHEPLLGAVVEVALDAPALGVGGRDDARAGVLRARSPGRSAPGRRSSRAAAPRASRRGGRARPAPGCRPAGSARPSGTSASASPSVSTVDDPELESPSGTAQ